MALYTLTGEIEPSSPVLLQALSGWVDAGGAGTETADFIAGAGRVVAYFDPDALFDYRSNRPILDFVDGVVQDVKWPEITIRFTSMGARDVLVMSGSEPDLRWREFASSVGELAANFGVTRLISVGAVPAAVPHTIDTPVMMTASSKELLIDERVPQGLLRVPSAAVSIVDRHIGQLGIETVGFWAQVPHYVTDPYSPAVLALASRVLDHLGLQMPLDTLRKQSDEQRRNLDEIVAGRPEAKEYVERLENMASAESGLGQQLASEVERFLRDVGGDNPFDEGS